MKLDLQHNELQTIPRCILELPSLCELNLSNNKLTDIPDVPEWSSCLTVLDLSHNQLNSMPLNAVATAIRNLNLSYNMFRTIPLCICSFTTLHALDLSFNPDILTLPAEMGRLTNLTRLTLKGLKDLNDPPRNVQRDTRDCIRYLNSKLRCAKGFYRMKLMLVGLANRGKTTLVARLQGRDCGDESTVGVDVSEWTYKPSLGKKPFFFSIWDFGGQEEYYATHQCFLSQRSLYLLLFNLKDGMEGVQELKPWLNNISLRAPRSMVIIIGTHLDQVADEERDEVTHLLQEVGKLASSYKNLQVVEVIPVGLKNHIENIGLLKEAIYNHASTYKNRGGQLIMGQKIPASYHSLDKQLEGVQQEVRNGLREPIMHSEEFKTMVQQMALADIQDDDELKTATLFLTDVGSLLHYDDRSHNLHELYFIDPRWLCDMMSKVVTIKERNPYVKKGILYSKDIPLIFKDDQFPWQYFEQYLTLLDRFEIALPLDNRRILIPSMLPDVRPSNADIDRPSEAPHYSRYIMFSSADTPPGFWSRLLSRIMHSVGWVGYALDKMPTDQQEVPECDPSERQFDTVSIMGEPAPSSTNSTQPTTPLISGPLSLAGAQPGLEIPRLLPNFPSSLPMGLAESHHISKIHLEYWRTGLFYSDPDIFFCIESLLGSSQFRREESKDGVLIVASPNSQGKKIIGQLVDLVVSLVSEWYPGLTEGPHGGTSGLEQKVPCYECLKQGRPKPFEFKVEQCLPKIAMNQMTIECGYFRDDPAKNHTVPLADIVPDLLLQDINPDFLLNAEDISYSEEESELLGKGGYGKVYRGKCHGKSVAIKKYLTRNEEAFSELRTEAKLLQKAHHPCLVCLVGVCLHPMMALVMELAPLGSLEKPLIKKKVTIHRLTMFRMAAEVAAALQFLHSRGIIFRDLKAANVLLWTLDPESLCHCKVTDFGIATHLSPVGARGLLGTKGFIAPEVLHVGKRKQRSVYDHKADIFSFGMFLYQMIARRHPYHDIPPHKIDSAVEMKERPKLQDVNAARSAYHYLTQLMQVCWEDNPQNRPTTDEIIDAICLSPMQAVMCVYPMKSKFSLRRICAITPHDFTLAGVARTNSELWVCCDGAEGAEVNIYNTNTMVKISKNFIKENQVQCICLCGDHVWVSSRAGIEYGVIDIFSVATRELVHNIRMRENSVSCITCSDKTVYLGTLEGYCFSFSRDIKRIQANAKPRYKYVSEHAVDGIACTMQCVWVSHTRYIYFLNLDTLTLEGSIKRQKEHDAFIGQLILSADCSIVWSAHLGGVTLSAWDAHQKIHKFDINTAKHLQDLADKSLPQNDIVITAMTTAIDNVWVGMASGHILVFHEDELLTWYHPYSEYVRFLCCIPCTGPCDTEQCMVISGAKGFHSGTLIPNLKNTEEESGDNMGVLVLWEAFSSRTTRQIKSLEEQSGRFLTNHNAVRTVILDEEFKDGTHIIPKAMKDPGSLVASTMVNTEGEEHTGMFDTSVSLNLETHNGPRVYDSIRERRTNFMTQRVSTSPVHAVQEVIQESQDEPKEPPVQIVKPRTRTSTNMQETFDVQLPSNDIVRLSCPKPAKLKVLLSELQVNSGLDEDRCKIEYCKEEEDSEERILIQTQEQLDQYLQLLNKPKLFLSRPAA